MLASLKIDIDSNIMALIQIVNAGILLVFFFWADKRLKKLSN
jgi:hypothetical protein